MRVTILLGLIWTSGCAASHPGAEDAGDDPDAADADAGRGDPDAGSGPCEAPDTDCDGHDAIEAGGDDCDDEDPSRHPGAPDGVWNFETIGEFSEGLIAGSAVQWDGPNAPTFAWSSWTRDWEPQSNPIRISSFVEGVRRIELPSMSESETHPFCCGVSSVVVDREGATLVGFHRSLESGAYQFRVLRGVDGKWDEEDVNHDPFQSYGTLMVDRDGEPNAVYVGDDLRHARRRADGSWSTERIDARGVDPQMAVAADGYLHVSYGMALDPTEIRYATNGSGDWVVTTVCAGEHAPLQTSIVVDANGVPTVFHQDAAGLVADTQTEDGWSESVVDSSSNGSFHAAIDPADVLHVAYQVTLDGHDVFTANELRHAWGQGGLWSTEVVSVGYLGSFDTPRISVGAAGTVRIGFDDSNPDTVQLALGTPAGDGIDQDCDGHAD